jgi:hypothetical protein
LLAAWLSDKLVYEVQDETFALQVVEEKVKYANKEKNEDK